MRESADKNSKLICQVLKSTNCEKCGAKGHSAFLCKNLAGSVWEKGQAKDAREREFRDQMEMKTTVLPSAVYTGQGNIFAVLNRKVASSLSIDDDQDDRIQRRKRERDQNKCRRTLAPPPQLVVPVSVPVPSSETGVSAGWVKLAPLAPVFRANTRWSARPTIMVEKRPVILERAIVELVELEELPIVPISTLMINCLALPKSKPNPSWADMVDEEEEEEECPP